MVLVDPRDVQQCTESKEPPWMEWVHSCKRLEAEVARLRQENADETSLMVDTNAKLIEQRDAARAEVARLTAELEEARNAAIRDIDYQKSEVARLTAELEDLAVVEEGQRERAVNAEEQRDAARDEAARLREANIRAMEKFHKTGDPWSFLDDIRAALEGKPLAEKE